MVTIGLLRRKIQQGLREAGVSSPAFEASQILKERLGMTQEELLLGYAEPVPDEAVSEIWALVSRRCQGEPLQYLLGNWSFYGYTFAVGPGVLIPRADTEILVDTALWRLEAGMRVADLCSGSGCVAVAIAKERPDVAVTAVELSDGAIPFLRRNVRQNACPNIEVFQDDVLRPSLPATEAFDMLVCNPPYIRRGELDSLQREVHHEPRMALDGGEDGLLFYKGILLAWRDRLRPGGWLLYEVGHDQAEEVAALFWADGFGDVFTESDYAGKSRVVGGRA